MENKYDLFLNNYLKEDYELSPLGGGANSRVFSVKIARKIRFVLKHYFTHPDDKRNRLLAEQSFLLFAWKNHIRNIPKPIFFDSTANMGLLSFIENDPFNTKDLNQDSINKAADFFLKLNQKKLSSADLPLASEACLSIDDYFYTVDQKIDKLIQNLVDEDVRKFLYEELIPYWERLKSTAFLQSKSFKKKFSDAQLCVTPSDFGFHNALITKEKDIYFIDFEYAGKDDPVKTLCDFFCQPQFPVSFKFFPYFFSRIRPVLECPEEILERFYFVFPVCQVKWCCIMLAAFSKVGKKRRQFSQNKEEKTQQLLKVKQYFKSRCQEKSLLFSSKLV